MDAMRWVSALALGLALAGCGSESTDWKSATAADTSEAYQQYLQQHPSGANAGQAKAHLAQLQEDRDWQSASSADNRAAYEQFLAQHPDGKWAQEARIRVENFAQGGATGVPAAAASAVPAAAATPPKSAPPTRVASVATHQDASGAAVPAHLVQLGAFSSQARAESHWKVLQTRFPAQFKSMQPRFVPGKAKAAHLVRLQVSVSTAERARDLCVALHKRSQACVPVTA
jgi:cell division septation protein DedD